MVRGAAHVTGVLQIAVTAWIASAAVLVIAGLLLLLAGRLNARHRNGTGYQRSSLRRGSRWSRRAGRWSS